MSSHVKETEQTQQNSNNNDTHQTGDPEIQHAVMTFSDDDLSTDIVSCSEFIGFDVPDVPSDEVNDPSACNNTVFGISRKRSSLETLKNCDSNIDIATGEVDEAVPPKRQKQHDIENDVANTDGTTIPSTPQQSQQSYHSSQSPLVELSSSSIDVPSEVSSCPTVKTKAEAADNNALKVNNKYSPETTSEFPISSTSNHQCSGGDYKCSKYPQRTSLLKNTLLSDSLERQLTLMSASNPQLTLDEKITDWKCENETSDIEDVSDFDQLFENRQELLRKRKEQLQGDNTMNDEINSSPSFTEFRKAILERTEKLRQEIMEKHKDLFKPNTSLTALHLSAQRLLQKHTGQSPNSTTYCSSSSAENKHFFMSYGQLFNAVGGGEGSSDIDAVATDEVADAPSSHTITNDVGTMEDLSRHNEVYEAEQEQQQKPTCPVNSENQHRDELQSIFRLYRNINTAYGKFGISKSSPNLSDLEVRRRNMQSVGFKKPILPERYQMSVQQQVTEQPNLTKHDGREPPCEGGATVTNASAAEASALSNNDDSSSSFHQQHEFCNYLGLTGLSTANAVALAVRELSNASMSRRSLRVRSQQQIERLRKEARAAIKQQQLMKSRGSTGDNLVDASDVLDEEATTSTTQAIQLPIVSTTEKMNVDSSKQEQRKRKEKDEKATFANICKTIQVNLDDGNTTALYDHYKNLEHNNIDKKGDLQLEQNRRPSASNASNCTTNYSKPSDSNSMQSDAANDADVETVSNPTTPTKQQEQQELQLTTADNIPKTSSTTSTSLSTITSPKFLLQQRQREQQHHQQQQQQKYYINAAIQNTAALIAELQASNANPDQLHVHIRNCLRESREAKPNIYIVQALNHKQNNHINANAIDNIQQRATDDRDRKARSESPPRYDKRQRRTSTPNTTRPESSTKSPPMTMTPTTTTTTTETTPIKRRGRKKHTSPTPKVTIRNYINHPPPDVDDINAEIKRRMGHTKARSEKSVPLNASADHSKRHVKRSKRNRALKKNSSLLSNNLAGTNYLTTNNTNTDNNNVIDKLVTRSTTRFNSKSLRNRSVSLLRSFVLTDDDHNTTLKQQRLRITTNPKMPKKKSSNTDNRFSDYLLVPPPYIQKPTLVQTEARVETIFKQSPTHDAVPNITTPKKRKGLHRRRKSGGASSIDGGAGDTVSRKSESPIVLRLASPPLNSTNTASDVINIQNMRHQTNCDNQIDNTIPGEGANSVGGSVGVGVGGGGVSASDREHLSLENTTSELIEIVDSNENHSLLNNQLDGHSVCHSPTSNVSYKSNVIQFIAENPISPGSLNESILHGFYRTSNPYKNPNTTPTNRSIVDVRIPQQRQRKFSITCLSGPSDAMTNPLQKKYGPVLYIYYELDVLIAVQEKAVSFWKYSKLFNLLQKRMDDPVAASSPTPETTNDSASEQLDNKISLQNSWVFLGSCDHLTNDIEIPTSYANRICVHNSMPVYLEMRCHSVPHNRRDCNLLSLYVNIYLYNDEELHPKMKSIYLDSVQGNSANVVYTTIRESRYFMMVWPQETPLGKTRTGICKYSIAPNLDTLASIREFKCLKHEIKYLECLGDDKLIGYGITEITIWDHRSGDILMIYDTRMNLGRNLGAIYYPSLDVEQNSMLVLFQHMQKSTDDNHNELWVIACEISHTTPTHRLLQMHALPSPNFDDNLISTNTGEHLIIKAPNDEEIWITCADPKQLVHMAAQNTQRFYTQQRSQVIELTEETLAVDNIANHMLKLASRDRKSI